MAAPGRAHRPDRGRDRLLPRSLARQLPGRGLRPQLAVRRQRRGHRARLRLRRDRLAGRPGRVQRPVRPHARPAAARGAPADRQGRSRPGQVLPVHARPQGRRHPVPVRHDRLLPDRRPVRHGHPERAALAVVPPHRPRAVPDGGRRARHDDDDDDVLGHPRSVRPVLRAAADRVQAGRVPAARGARLLAHPGRLRHPAVRRAVRRVPHRLDRVRAAGPPGHSRGRTPTSSRSA